MASPLTHAVAAFTLAGTWRITPLSWRHVWLGVICAELPDVDVAGFWLGVPYESWLGHRGITHSMAFAFVVSWLLTGLIGERGGSRHDWLWGYLFLATLSHSFLDAMTDGGLGVAFFAPIDPSRYFFPFHPVKVTPLDPSHAFGPAGLAVLVSEVAWIWAPCGLVLLWSWQRNNGRAVSSSE